MKLLPDIRLPRGNKLEDVTFRGFGGGWNAVHDDISMSPKYLVTAKNVLRTPSGACTVRYGTQWFADGTGTATGTTIIDMEYFNGRFVCVTNTGQVFTIDSAGAKVLIWSSAIAALLVGAPSGWSATTQVDFVPFRSALVIHNGIDKPISISSSFVVTYLKDLASGSNVNVPIGKYGCTVSNYHCVAGIPSVPTTIYISAVGTAGTFPGDPDPNDAISIDVGAYAPDGASEIRGIAGFKTYLIVSFVSRSLVVTLGNYTDDVHVPQFPDELPQYGLLGHRCYATLPSDLHFANFFGVSSAKRNLVSGLFDTKQLSELIEPDYRSEIDAFTASEQQLEIFALHNPLDHTTMIFLPDGKVFVYASNDEPNIRFSGWSHFEDMNWTCGATTILGRVFLASGMRVFQMGNGVYDDEAHHADRLLDRDSTWAVSTAYVAGVLAYDSVGEKSYTCNVTHTSGSGTFAEDRTDHPEYWTEYEGEAIDFDIEMPWIDGSDPMKTKQLKFASVGSKGTAEFELKIYVDNLHRDADDVEIFDPALTVNMIGNDAYGYGGDAGPMGGGRPSKDPRLLSTPCKFKTIKFRYTGSIRKPLTIANQTFLFLKGKFRR